MTSIKTSVILALASASLSGCASSPMMVQGREAELGKYGFEAHPVNTDARHQMFAGLVPYQVSEIPNGMTKLYAYPDPKFCGCLYVGSAKAWSDYQTARKAEKISDRQLIADKLSVSSWDWNAWRAPGTKGAL
jgi:hypothetical protein